MASLAPETDLYKQYLDILAEQEDELKTLADRIEQLTKQEESQRLQLERYIRTMQYDQ